MGRNTADAMVLTIANPLVLLHLVSGAHNEALMLAFLMSGLAIGSRPRYRHVGIALCAFAATIKVPALVGAVFLAWPWIVAPVEWRRRLARLLVSGAEILAVITLATRSTPWGWGAGTTGRSCSDSPRPRAERTSRSRPSRPRRRSA